MTGRPHRCPPDAHSVPSGWQRSHSPRAWLLVELKRLRSLTHLSADGSRMLEREIAAARSDLLGRGLCVDCGYPLDNSYPHPESARAIFDRSGRFKVAAGVEPAGEADVGRSAGMPDGWARGVVEAMVDAGVVSAAEVQPLVPLIHSVLRIAADSVAPRIRRLVRERDGARALAGDAVEAYRVQMDEVRDELDQWKASFGETALRDVVPLLGLRRAAHAWADAVAAGRGEADALRALLVAIRADRPEVSRG